MKMSIVLNAPGGIKLAKERMARYIKKAEKRNFMKSADKRP